MGTTYDVVQAVERCDVIQEKSRARRKSCAKLETKESGEEVSRFQSIRYEVILDPIACVFILPQPNKQLSGDDVEF